MAITATLTGTWNVPVLRIAYPFGARLPGGREAKEWVKSLGSRWDPETKTWIVTDLGLDPQATLDGFGIVLDRSGVTDPRLAAARLRDLASPLLMLSEQWPGTVLVRPRLTGFTRLRELFGPGWATDKTTGRVEVHVTDLLGKDGLPRPGLDLTPEMVEMATTARTRMLHRADFADVSVLALAVSVEAAGEAGQRVIAAVGDVPDWFGLDLFKFQRAGGIAAAAGALTISDDPGLGKTREALAAHAIRGTERLIIVSPPVALTHWQREAADSRVTLGPRKPGEALGRSLDHTVVIESGDVRRITLPKDRGIIVVSDSVLAASDPVRALLREWQADGAIDDEAHRHKTWESARSRAVRATAFPIANVIAVSGTPMTKDCTDLAPIAAITGQLGPIFGGRSEYLNSYAREITVKGRSRGWTSRAQAQPALRRRLDGLIWVRRHKADVLPQLPPKSRHPLYVDVPLTAFRAAHREVAVKVRDWLLEVIDTTGDLPDADAVKGWAGENLGLLSPLLRAAGLAKVGAVTDWARDWVESHPAKDGVYDEPTAIWAHHKEVFAALGESLRDAVEGVEIIDGSTTREERDRIVDAYQEGKVPLLLASITAAGVGITLTRASMALFAESNYTPALVSQAEDRHHRIGSTRPVTILTMVAAGTLDEQVQDVQKRTGERLAPLLGDTALVHVGPQTERKPGSSASVDVLLAVVNEIVHNPGAAVVKALARAGRTPARLAG